MDLVCSPNNSLNQSALGRTAATYTIIHIVNQLFIANNDIIKLGWLERESYTTEKAKWDGVLFKVGNKSISPELIEFSGGCNDKTSSSKNQRGITKLYSNMFQLSKYFICVIMVKSWPIFFHYFILNYYSFWTIGKSIYFEKLTRYNGFMFRTIHVAIEVPTTPRNLIAYLQELPKILAWKEAVVNYAIQFK